MLYYMYYIVSYIYYIYLYIYMYIHSKMLNLYLRALTYIFTFDVFE